MFFDFILLYTFLYKQLTLVSSTQITQRFSVLKVASQLTFTCSKSTTKTLDKGVKYVQHMLNIFHTFF